MGKHVGILTTCRRATEHLTSSAMDATLGSTKTGHLLLLGCATSGITPSERQPYPSVRDRLSISDSHLVGYVEHIPQLILKSPFIHRVDNQEVSPPLGYSFR